MAYDVTSTYAKEQVKTQGVYPVDMYVVNASRTGTDYLYFINLNQNTVGYSLSATGMVTSGTTLYTAAPISREPVRTNIQGEIDGISINIPNTNRIVESLIQNYDYLRGRTVYTIGMFARNMPADSGADTANYIGIEPDYRSHMREKFTIDTVNSNEQAVTFICKSKFDIKHITIPNRIFTPECQWSLRGDYLGTACNASKNINATTYPTCDGTLTACRKRGNTSRFGGFPSIPKLR